MTAQERAVKLAAELLGDVDEVFGSRHWCHDEVRDYLREDAVVLFGRAIREAEDAAFRVGQQSILDRLSVFGTDACRECESGRVTLWTVVPVCKECENAELKGGGS